MAKVMIARISRGSTGRDEIGSWLVSAFADNFPENYPGVISMPVIDQEPTTCARNKCVKIARSEGVDIVVMVDNDMIPSWNFYQRAVMFLVDHPGPYAIGSPYCGAAPARQVQVIHTDARRYTRREAEVRRHIEQVAAIGTGLIAFNMACFDIVKPPYFDYIYKDAEMTEVEGTEDINYCNRLVAAGGKVYCDWESWSLHAKTERVGKPGEDASVIVAIDPAEDVADLTGKPNSVK